MTQTIFQAEKRSDKKTKQLRREGILPANVFGAAGSLALQVNSKGFADLYEEAGETGLIYLNIAGDNKQRPVLIDEVQMDPVDGSLIHASFKQVDLTDTIEAEVPVETIGKFEVPEGVLMVVKDEITVEALPTDLPEKFEIDVSVLTEIGQVIAYKDLKYDRSKVKLILGEEGEDEPVVLVQEQQQEEPAEEAAPAEGEEGAAAPAEGGEKPEGDQSSDKPADSAEEN